MDWNKLQQYHLNPPTLANAVHREPHVQQEYDQFKRNNPAHINSLADHLFRDSDITVELNRFPYHIAEGYHLVVWINRGVKFDEKDLMNTLKFLGISEYVIFENLPVHQSIPLIHHYQLFLRHYTDVIKVLTNPLL